MANSEGFRELYRPWLEEKLNQSFPDPSKFVKEEEFVYAAKMASVFKKVVAEILQWVDGAVDEAKQLQRKEKGEVKDQFRIGE